MALGLMDAVGRGAVYAGLVDILENMFKSAKDLIVMALILVAMTFVISTWMRSRSLVPTLGAFLVGALVVWGVASFDWFAEKVGEDVEDFENDPAEVDTGVEGVRPGD